MASNTKIKRPKSDGRCVHCGKNPEKLTKDHVFPDSWYPESTPGTVQHWTVPACLPCNGELGLVEKEVFVRLGLCVNPQKVAATGISKRVIRSLGIRAEGLDEDEKRIRAALKDEVLRGAKPFAEEDRPHILPGTGPHWGPAAGPDPRARRRARTLGRGPFEQEQKNVAAVIRRVLQLVASRTMSACGPF